MSLGKEGLNAVEVSVKIIWGGGGEALASQTANRLKQKFLIAPRGWEHSAPPSQDGTASSSCAEAQLKQAQARSPKIAKSTYHTSHITRAYI
jgi:hypothetical protein